THLRGDLDQLPEGRDRRDEEIRAPAEPDQRRAGLVVEGDAQDSSGILEPERPWSAHLWDAEEGIAFSGEHVGAVPAGDPALDRLELLCDAGVVGHEDQAAFRVLVICVAGPVRHPATYDARDQALPRVARIGTSNVGLKRTLAPERVARI